MLGLISRLSLLWFILENITAYIAYLSSPAKQTLCESLKLRATDQASTFDELGACFLISNNFVWGVEMSISLGLAVIKQ